MDDVKKNDSTAAVISENRRKRINRLKKIIVTTVISAILIPTILCVGLFIRVWQLEHKITRLEDEKALVDAELVALSQNASDSADTGGEEARQAMSEEVVLSGSNEVTQNVDSDANTVISAEGHQDDLVQEENQEIVEDYEVPDDGIRRVYLTFDDGPSSNTEEILRILSEYEVKATFFVVGKTDAHSVEMYQRIVEEGHTLGMHSYSHKYQELYSSVDAFVADLERMQEYLYGITGTECEVFRFPGGSSNSVSDVDIQELIDVLEERNITYYDWNASTGDGGSRLLSAQEIVTNVMADIEQYHNIVVLMHDAIDKPTTVEALPELIEQLFALPNTVILPITDSTVRVQHVKPE